MERIMRASNLCTPKYDERRAGGTWLSVEIEKAVKKMTETYDWNRHDKRSKTQGASVNNKKEEAQGDRHEPQGGIDAVRASTIEMKEVRWLWDKRIPLGKLTIFDGDPDLGKSVVTVDIAARVSTGRDFPDGAKCDPAPVIMCNVEDGADDTIVPRLDAHNADLDSVYLFSSVPSSSNGKDSTKRLLDLPRDVEMLEELVKEKEAKLLIIDPVLTMLGGDVYKDQEARKALTPVKDMAERTGGAVIGVRHLNKAVGLKAIQRGGGNMGLIGVARAGVFFAEHPDDNKMRVFAPHKSNLAQKQPSLTYRVVTGGAHKTALIEWVGVTEHDANTLAADSPIPHEKGKLEEAQAFLQDELKDGPMWATQIYIDARKAGVAERTLLRAKDALHVKSSRIGNEGWQWALPHKPSRRPGKDEQEEGGQDKEETKETTKEDSENGQGHDKAKSEKAQSREGSQPQEDEAESEGCQASGVDNVGNVGNVGSLPIDKANPDSFEDGQAKDVGNLNPTTEALYI
jgi:hypothetical protein